MPAKIDETRRGASNCAMSLTEHDSESGSTMLLNKLKSSGIL